MILLRTSRAWGFHLWEMRKKMQTSPSGVAFIQENEGFTPTPKGDNGQLMWGYGHDQRPGETPPVSITPEDATALLNRDLAEDYEHIVNQLVPRDCTQNQFDALADFCYNLGPDKFQTMMSHGWDEVPTQMLRWSYSNGAWSSGLEDRRQREVNLFNTIEKEVSGN